MDLWMRMDWHRGGYTILDEACEAVDENRASSVPESKVLIPAEWWVQIGRTWGGVYEVLGTWDDKLSESSEKLFIQIRSGLVRLWVVDVIEKKVYAQERQHDETHKVSELLDQNNDTLFYLYHNPKGHK